MGISIALEGLPGSGKSTAAKAIINDLAAQDLRVRMVDIDTAPSTAELRGYADACPSTHPQRMMALWLLRIQQHEAIKAILPDMDAIVSDRSWWSAVAIDGYGNGVARDFLGAIGRQMIMPDIVLLLDAPLGVLYKRKGESRTLQDHAFARRVARGYRILARVHGWQVIDATRTPEQVKEQCLAIIRTALVGKMCQ